MLRNCDALKRAALDVAVIVRSRSIWSEARASLPRVLQDSNTRPKTSDPLSDESGLCTGSAWVYRGRGMPSLRRLAFDLFLVAPATGAAAVTRDNFEIVAPKLIALVPYLVITLSGAGFVFPNLGISRSLWEFSSMRDGLRIVGATIIVVRFTTKPMATAPCDISGTPDTRRESQVGSVNVEQVAQLAKVCATGSPPDHEFWAIRERINLAGDEVLYNGHLAPKEWQTAEEIQSSELPLDPDTRGRCIQARDRTIGGDAGRAEECCKTATPAEKRWFLTEVA